MDTWQMIRAERQSLVDALAGLPVPAWEQPSLCAGWTVRDVVAHVIATASMTPPRFFAKMIGSGFRFDAMVAKEIAAVISGRSDAELVDMLSTRVDARTAPPGPALSWLGETIVHGEDVFRALGGYREHPAPHLIAVADFYRGSDLLIGAKSRIAGVTLTASDAQWRYGSGPEVTGPLVALVMAMTGRTVALDDLAGDGVAVLRERTATHPR
ncbi:maleylpyruvate isomerase family mycothiol-dependent enzyme [Krasilnikovia sp. MM14-A1259]|uniref:maleylpyruvate isomerase family mycothiol-dependent enzyme n=1 Tax=Krasilnikovia sp. MM14-A1259 TaxID=3373539 RepID=UPI003821159B